MNSAPTHSQELTNRNWDSVIVGAGPGGLFAALGLLAGGRTALVLEAGGGLRSRHHWDDSVYPSADLVEGVGGAGLFSDGKLCMSFQVGGDLGLVRSALEQDRLLGIIAEVLDPGATRSATDSDLIAERQRAALDAGLEFSHYPVRHVGTERCGSRIDSLVQLIESLGGVVLADHRVDKITRGVGGFQIEDNGPGGPLRLSARSVVLAMGKVGAAQERDLSVSLGATVKPTAMFLGVRIENEQTRFAPLFDGILDPKYKLLSTDGSKMKTHCAAEGGAVLGLSYNGLPLAGGHSRSAHDSGRSSVGILWSSGRPECGLYEQAMHVLAMAANITGGRLLVQRMGDYRANRASRRSSGGPLARDQLFPGNIRDILPGTYFEAFDEFIARLSRLVPGVADDEMLIYGPSVEWWMEKIATDEHMQAVPGLYAVGDGAGWSQGIVQAAGTGLAAAEHISGRILSRDEVVTLTTQVSGRVNNAPHWNELTHSH
jgi:uncharacterized FAD-dependent dehydrogenase